MNPSRLPGNSKLFTPSVSCGKFCSLTALHGKSGTEKQLRRAESSVGKISGFLFSVWVPDLRKQPFEAQGENVVLGWCSLPKSLCQWAGQVCNVKTKPWIQKRAARPLNPTPTGAASACFLWICGTCAPCTPTKCRAQNTSGSPTAPTVVPCQLSRRKNWRWIISWILTNSQAPASLPLCSATEEQSVLLTGKFCQQCLLWPSVTPHLQTYWRPKQKGKQVFNLITQLSWGNHLIIYGYSNFLISYSSYLLIKQFPENKPCCDYSKQTNRRPWQIEHPIKGRHQPTSCYLSYPRELSRAGLCSCGSCSTCQSCSVLCRPKITSACSDPAVLGSQKEGGANLGRTCLERTAWGSPWEMSSECVSGHTWLRLFQSAVGWLTDCRTADTRSHPLRADAALPVQGELSCSCNSRRDSQRFPTPESPQGLLRNPLSLECFWKKAPSSDFQHMMRSTNYLETHPTHSITEKCKCDTQSTGIHKILQVAVIKDPREICKELFL